MKNKGYAIPHPALIAAEIAPLRRGRGKSRSIARAPQVGRAGHVLGKAALPLAPPPHEKEE